MQLFCSSCAAFTLNFFLSLSNGKDFGFLSFGTPGLVDFGVFGTVCPSISIPITSLNFVTVTLLGRQSTMECLSPDHLHADGGGGWTAGSSL